MPGRQCPGDQAFRKTTQILARSPALGLRQPPPPCHPPFCRAESVPLRLGRDLLSPSSPKEPEPRQCLAPAQPPLAQNHLQNVDRSNPLQCRAPSPQSTPTRLLDLSASKILTPTIFPLKTDRKSTEDCLSLGFFSLVPFSTAPWCEPHSPGIIERRTRA